MKLNFEGQVYDVITLDNSVVVSINKMLPFTLKLSRSAEHEYYSTLPDVVDISEAESASHVKAGWLYYFKDWNAFALNFKETVIAPYKVYVIGEVVGGIDKVLNGAGQSIEVEIAE